MVAGMLMPLQQLRAIYELLFRDGVMVAKNDRRPQSQHPELGDVTNLQVIQALRSLKCRGFVRESFVWKHHYWYLTDEGIRFLQQFLHLPADIVPVSLHRVPRATRRAAPPPARPLPRPRPAPRVEGQWESREYRRIEELTVEKVTEVKLEQKIAPRAG
ncbi:40S ribosomal protein S10-like [Carcharodon carcharias]|uniref:40S ribosomal protein S10-like n=1 Tax=Carcharodon carcharias TaxID=13397 RepID=UPI001B7F2B8D|nr:40S ribosomal protein S10-like [Carcharodon carcharias]